ncbi:MAG: LPS export ABC transporter periplasmic protein LptC [Rikenellaceae bacterium]
MRKFNIYNCLVALLVLGSAISLLSCKEHKVVSAKVSRETLMSESSDSLTIVVSENGRLSYRFTAPLVEGYTMAREPYREFRKGVTITTYLNDSLQSVDATLRANYAIYYSNLKLWETKGDVVVVKGNGKELYTQQLFWNSTTKRIYSNVDTKIVDTNNDDVYNGEGFESDEEMKVWSFRKMKGRMRVDTTPTPADSVKVDSVDVDRSVAKDSADKEDNAQQSRPKFDFSNSRTPSDSEATQERKEFARRDIELPQRRDTSGLEAPRKRVLIPVESKDDEEEDQINEE